MKIGFRDLVLKHYMIEYSQIVVLFIEDITICGRLGYGISLEIGRSVEDQLRGKRVHGNPGANLLSEFPSRSRLSDFGGRRTW